MLLFVKRYRRRLDAVGGLCLRRAHKPLVTECHERPPVDPQRTQLLFGDTHAETLECLERLPLAWGARKPRAVARRRGPGQRPSRLRHRAAPGRGRQQGRIHLAQGVVVVVAKPLGERNQIGHQEPIVIEDVDHRLQAMRGRLAKSGDDSDHLGAAERHADPGADMWLGKLRRKRIVENATQGARDRDLNDWPRHRSIRPGMMRELTMGPDPTPIK